ncbi:MAG: hypothetical protein KKC84_01985, partial [Candidatus Omnitrophica bacterium]|nr:hypothetical protein [Candidatus Omnitrophota bacterium]
MRKENWGVVAVIVIAFFLGSMTWLSCAQAKKDEQPVKQEEIQMGAQLKVIEEAAQKKEVDTVIKLSVEYIKTDSANIGVYCLIADAYLSKGDFINAEKSITSALSIDPTNTWPLKSAAKIYRMLAEQAETPEEKKKILIIAKEKVEQVLKTSPDDPLALAEAASI